MKKIQVSGFLPPRFDEGFEILNEELGLTLSESGFPIILNQADHFTLNMEETRAVIGWSKVSEVYRGLSLLRQHWGSVQTFDQPMAFETAGIT